MAVQIVSPTVDHAALDRILSHLERRYGFDPRLDRAYRIVMSERVELSTEDPTAGLVHGDSGKSYWATVNGFCECPDAQRVSRCKHALSVIISAQLAAVAKSKSELRDKDAQFRSHYLKLCTEHQQHGRELIARGYRPIDDAVYLERDLQLQSLKARLPVPTLR